MWRKDEPIQFFYEKKVLCPHDKEWPNKATIHGNAKKFSHIIISW